MSIFNIDKVQKEEKKEFAEIPEGKYTGKIVKVEQKKTQAGHNVLNLQIKTDAGLVFNGLNFDHPKCAVITQQTVAKILNSYENPPKEVDTLNTLADLMTGLPVEVFVKPKGKNAQGYTQYGVYFNDLDATKKVKLEAGIKKARVEY